MLLVKVVCQAKRCKSTVEARKKENEGSKNTEELLLVVCMLGVDYLKVRRLLKEAAAY